MAISDTRNTLGKNWSLSDGGQTPSLDKYQADTRLNYAVHSAVSAMTKKMTFKSPLEEASFSANTEKTLLAALRQGKRADIAGALKDVPDAALDAANKSLDASETRDTDNAQLIKKLTDFITASKAQNKSFAQRGKTGFLA